MWPVTDIIHRYLSNSCKYKKTKRKKAEEATGGADPNGNGGMGGPVPPNPTEGVGDNDIELSD